MLTTTSCSSPSPDNPGGQEAATNIAEWELPSTLSAGSPGSSSGNQIIASGIRRPAVQYVAPPPLADDVTSSGAAAAAPTTGTVTGTSASSTTTTTGSGATTGTLTGGSTGTTTTTPACTQLTSAELLAMLGNGPVSLAAGSDGNIYFTAYNNNIVGYYDPEALEFVYSPTDGNGLPTNAGPGGITLGPDGQFWIADFGLDGSTAYSVDEFNFAADDTFTLTQNSLPIGDSLTGPFEDALGPDGNVWATFNIATGLEEVTAEGVFGVQVPTLAQSSDDNPMPSGIVEGTDGALWFAETGVNKIARLDPATDTITNEYDLSPCSAPASLVVGSDGNLWFTEPGTQKIGKMAMTGANAGALLQEYTLQTGAEPIGITSGPDCNIWFTEAMTDSVGTINVTSGVVNDTTDTLSTGADPAGIVLGKDGNLYVAESGLGPNGAVAQVTVAPAAGSSNQCPAPVFPAIASRAAGPVTIPTSPGLCTAQVTTAEIDAGSSDPNSTTSPAAAPSEAVIPSTPLVHEAVKR